MNPYRLFICPVVPCLCAVIPPPASAAGIDSYDAALNKVKTVKAALDPLKFKNRLRNWINLGLQLESLKKGPPTWATRRFLIT